MLKVTEKSPKKNWTEMDRAIYKIIITNSWEKSLCCTITPLIVIKLNRIIILLESEKQQKKKLNEKK